MLDATPPEPVSAAGLRVGIAVSRYHADITGAMLHGAERAFSGAGGAPGDVLVVPAPGAWELLPVAVAMAERGDLHGVVCLGCILTGETTHDQWLAGGLASGLADLTNRTGLPAAFGVLTCQTREQAIARAGGGTSGDGRQLGNKGDEAMLATLGAISAARTARTTASGGPFPRSSALLAAPAKDVSP
ncbi:MAG: 6,7-dimethyl-8-ribityllumazine synthase [Phycisphaerales bacterium]